MSDGKEVHDLEWFRREGYMLREFQELDWYLYPALERQGLRFEMPYQERLTRHGKQLEHRLREIGLAWWKDQLAEYDFMPTYQSFSDIWKNHVSDLGEDPETYPFWALTAHSMPYSWGANVGIPLMHEAALNLSGHDGVIINRARARDLSINEGDPVIIKSVTGTTQGRAVLREGIRPDTILMIGQFDHWKTPLARDFGLASINSVTDISLKLTDSTGSSADLVRVNVYPTDQHLATHPDPMPHTTKT